VVCVTGILKSRNLMVVVVQVLDSQSWKTVWNPVFKFPESLDLDRPDFKFSGFDGRGQ